MSLVSMEINVKSVLQGDDVLTEVDAAESESNQSSEDPTTEEHDRKGDPNVSAELRVLEDLGEVKVEEGMVESKNELKPWKQKYRRNAHQSNFLDDVVILEGKSVIGPSLLEVTSPEDGYLRLICKDDAEFVIPYKVVECFKCVDVILHSDVVFKEKVDNVIRFPDIRAEVMDSVLRFVFIEHINKLKAAKYWGANSPRLVFQFEVEPGQVMELIYAAHFLGIQDLLNVTATMVARHFQDVPDVSSMPTDLAWCVAEQFTARELYDAEERPDFSSLNLNTEILWEKHCKKFLKEDIIRPISSPASYPSYSSWGFSEGPPPTSWKSMHTALDLQQLADRQDGGDNEALFLEVKYRGKHAYSCTVRPLFYDWVLSSPGSLSLAAYVSLYPNLVSLNLAKVPMGKTLADGTSPCLIVGEMLQCLPLLQHLDLSETGFTAQAASNLSMNLESHSRLQVLRLAYNNIKTEGFATIAQALPSARTLKLLDVRENGILPSMTEDSVAALQASSLEELLMEGDLRACNGRPYTIDHPTRSSSFQSEMARSRSGHHVLIVNTIGSSKSFSQVPDPFSASSIILPNSRTRVRVTNENVEGTSTAADASQQSRDMPCVFVVPVLSGLPSCIQVLKITQCDLVDSDIEILVQALRGHNVIQKLDLSDNKLTASGATSIFTWFQGNSSVVEIHLSNNNITDDCSAVLISLLRSHDRLQKLSLRGNYSYGEGSLPELISAGLALGERLLSTNSCKFVMDLRATDISYSTRARILRRDLSNVLRLLM